MAALLVWAAGGAGGAEPLPAGATEPVVKAAMVYRLLFFMEGQVEGRAVLRVAVVGRDAFTDALGAVAGRPVGRLAARLDIAALGGMRDGLALDGYDVLVVGASEARRVREILGGVRNRPILTVSDVGDFVADGGMIGFVKLEGSVRWEVNQDALSKAGLRMNSQVLRNAVRVIRSGGSNGGGPP